MPLPGEDDPYQMLPLRSLQGRNIHTVELLTSAIDCDYEILSMPFLFFGGWHWIIAPVESEHPDQWLPLPTQNCYFYHIPEPTI